MARIAISEIKIGQRIRKEIGDVSDLAESIQSVGLLHPVVLNEKGQLVCGMRRMEAFKALGHDSIPYVTVKTLDDVVRQTKAERDENICRKALSMEEAVDMGESFRPFVKEEVEAAHREGTKAGGETAGKGRPKDSSTKTFSKAVADDRNSRTSDAKIAASVGMSHTTYRKAAEVVQAARTEPEKFGKLLDEMNRAGRVNGVHKKLKTAKQAEGISKEPPPLPTGPFRVIAIDPPWQYDNRESDSSHRSANPYPSMSLDKIKAIDVGRLAHEDAVLWMWTTNAHLPVAFSVVAAWGFTYKTMLTWVKDRMGTGDWLRGKTEHCLMCIRGKPTIKLTNQTTVIHGPLRKHSEKPDEFYSLVEDLCPGSKAELFSRKPRKGWTCHGDEAV